MFKILKRDKYTTANEVILVGCEDIQSNPGQPRKSFPAAELMELSDSIKQNGLLQPITLRKNPEGGYIIVAGERRFRASILAGIKMVPSIVVDADERQAAILSVVENLQRADLSFFEEARGIEALIEMQGLTQEQIADKLGKSQSAVANKLRLLKLSSPECELITKNMLTERHARALIRVEDVELRKKALDRIIVNGFNVAQADRYIDELLTITGKAKVRKPIVKIKDMRIFHNTIKGAIEDLRCANINFESTQTDLGDKIEYVITIPKRKV
jgi:ParB family chromosome partitioning protein